MQLVRRQALQPLSAAGSEGINLGQSGDEPGHEGVAGAHSIGHGDRFTCHLNAPVAGQDHGACGSARDGDDRRSEFQPGFQGFVLCPVRV